MNQVTRIVTVELERDLFLFAEVGASGAAPVRALVGRLYVRYVEFLRQRLVLDVPTVAHTRARAPYKQDWPKRFGNRPHRPCCRVVLVRSGRSSLKVRSHRCAASGVNEFLDDGERQYCLDECKGCRGYSPCYSPCVAAPARKPTGEA